MREVIALLRAGWLTALSYRLNLAFALAGLIVGIVPLFFVAQALQPVAANSIAQEGGHYFGFLVIGLATYSLASTVLLALPNTVAGSISSGTLEAMLATPAPLPALLGGLAAYDITWSAVRAGVLLLLGFLLGPSPVIGGMPLALCSLALVLACYFGLGLGLAGMILVYRTIGPLGGAILTGSALLGGVYYSTRVIPSWIQNLSMVVPLTYGLRAERQALLAGASIASVKGDLLALVGLAALLVLVGSLLLLAGLRHARREGTLGQY